MDRKYKLLDLFCGAGGCTKGYQRAGFYVVGVDIKPQPHYCGDEFYQADALEYVAEHGAEYDAIHASPPCQAYSKSTPIAKRNDHPDLIGVTRDCLLETGKPFVIENVENARSYLTNPLLLCGTMFGIRMYRHRYFELNPQLFLLSPMSCQHFPNPVSWTYHRSRDDSDRHKRRMVTKLSQGGIDWMTGAELSQAIPPAYTEYIGKQLMQYLERG